MSEITYEAAVKRLQEIVRLLENGGMPLKESVELFEEGARLASFCNKELKEAEQKITALEDVNGD